MERNVCKKVFILLFMIILFASLPQGCAKIFSPDVSIADNAYMFGKNLFYEGKYREALKNYTLAIKKDPIKAIYYSNRAKAYFKLNDYQMAIEDFTVSIELAKNYDRKILENQYFLRGNIYYHLKEFKKAIIDYSKVIESITYKSEGNKAEYYNVRGNSYYQIKDYKNASKDYFLAVKEDNSSPVYYTNLGNVNNKLKRYGNSIVYYNKALELQPNAGLYVKIGDVYTALGEYDKALNSYGMAIDLESVGENFNIRGKAYAKSKGYEKALSDFDRAIELDSWNSSYYTNRAFVYEKLNRFDQAIKDHSKVINLKPSAKNYILRAISYKKNKNIEAAIEDYAMAIKIEPTDEIYSEIARLYLNIGKYKNANANFLKAIELNPINGFYYLEIGRLSYKLKNFRKAIKDFSKAIELLPDNSYAYFGRAQSYSSLIMYTEALLDYNDSLRLGGDFSEIHKNMAWIYLSLNLGKEALEAAKSILSIKGLGNEDGFFATIIGHFAYRIEGLKKEANNILEKGVLRFGNEVWSFAIAQYLLNRIPEEELILKTKKNIEEEIIARNIIGFNLYLLDKNDAASKHFQWVKENGIDKTIVIFNAPETFIQRSSVFKIDRFYTVPRTIKRGKEVSCVVEYSRPDARLTVKENWMMYHNRKPLYENEKGGYFTIDEKNYIHKKGFKIPEDVRPGVYEVRMRVSIGVPSGTIVRETSTKFNVIQ